MVCNYTCGKYRHTLCGLSTYVYMDETEEKNEMKTCSSTLKISGAQTLRTFGVQLGNVVYHV